MLCVTSSTSNHDIYCTMHTFENLHTKRPLSGADEQENIFQSFQNYKKGRILDHKPTVSGVSKMKPCAHFFWSMGVWMDSRPCHTWRSAWLSPQNGYGPPQTPTDPKAGTLVLTYVGLLLSIEVRGWSYVCLPTSVLPIPAPIECSHAHDWISITSYLWTVNCKFDAEPADPYLHILMKPLIHLHFLLS